MMSNATSSSSSLVLLSWLSSDSLHVPSESQKYTPSGLFATPTIRISQDEYDRLRLHEFSQTGHLSTHTSSSSMDAYIASAHRPWILHSRASSHITGIKDNLPLYISLMGFLLLTLMMVHSLMSLAMRWSGYSILSNQCVICSKISC